jgi:hypothetical protein
MVFKLRLALVLALVPDARPKQTQGASDYHLSWPVRLKLASQPPPFADSVPFWTVVLLNKNGGFKVRSQCTVRTGCVETTCLTGNGPWLLVSCLPSALAYICHLRRLHPGESDAGEASSRSPGVQDRGCCRVPYMGLAQKGTINMDHRHCQMRITRGGPGLHCTFYC